ncbi:protein kinase [Streptomyces sp. A7024]|uniref:non-specific serine/threonine protein kinase n=1 Tax=Streptomyces coryli TaxID=1128680 RepID=A0A6G4TSH1_9ACTN|nr:serine/threonine-protein kinase [Streptomyces coryli]NGN62743.1 protein kinase [Streptomyces coryli]
MIEGGDGQVVDGRFELLERLGSGGMGTVWRARDQALDREVALKQVRPLAPELAPEGSAASRVLRERMLREARALARISHPNVVTIHHVVDDGEAAYPWLVMELVPGRSLAERLADGALPPTEAARIGRQVLAGLRTAHAAGICHRDVKPANVMLRPDGAAVLTDFGIAALQRTGQVDPAVGSASLTATGELIGTPDYLAPERIRGTDDEPASDLWSLGMLLYVAVEGHNPLRRTTPLATLAAVLDGEVPPPVRAGALTPVLAELLVRDPAARPSAARLDEMLGAAAEAGGLATAPLAEAEERTLTATQPVSQSTPQPAPQPAAQPAQPSEPAAEAPPAAPVPAPRRRRAWLTAGAAVLAAVLVAITAYSLGDTGGDGGDGGSDAKNKLDLVQPGTLTVAVSGDRSGSAHHLTYAASDSGWLEDASPGPKEGDWIGPDPELAKALAERLGLRVKVVGIDMFGPGDPFDALGRDYDVVMPSTEFSTFDAKERRGVDFIHYFDYAHTLYARWKTASKIRSWDDLCGLKVAPFEDDDKDALRDISYKVCGPDPIKVTNVSIFDLPEPLQKGSIDAVVSDLPFAVVQAKESDGEFHLPAADLTDAGPLGMAVKGSNTTLRKALTSGFDKLITGGDYTTILKNWNLEHGAVRATRIIRD